MKIKLPSFEEACRHQNVPETLPDLSMYPEKFSKGIIAFTKLIIIHAAVNNNREPDYSNPNEKKYYPWFWVKANEENPGGFAFDGSICGYSVTDAGLGSRLCVFDKEIMEAMIEEYKDIYLDFILIIK